MSGAERVATDLAIVPVAWDDPRAVQLRAQMDVEMSARYEGATPRPPEVQAAVRRALAVDPATIRATVLALTPGGPPLGHAALRDLRGEWEVKRVVVVGAARGHGVGRRLMTALETLARAGGAHRLILQTGDRQPDAVALYTGLGYSPIPVYEPYTRAMPSSLCFQKELVQEKSAL